MPIRKKPAPLALSVKKRAILFGKEIAKRNVLKAIRIVSERPALKSRALRILNRHPKLKNRLKTWAAARYQAGVSDKSRLVSKNVLAAWPPAPDHAFLDTLNHGWPAPEDMSVQDIEAIRQTYYQELIRQRNRMHALLLNR